MINTPRFAISPRSRSRAQGLVFVATMVAIFGACYAPQRAWPNLLLNGFYITSLAVSATNRQLVVGICIREGNGGLGRAAH